jgi:hypothetical protein
MARLIVSKTEIRGKAHVKGFMQRIKRLHSVQGGRE